MTKLLPKSKNLGVVQKLYADTVVKKQLRDNLAHLQYCIEVVGGTQNHIMTKEITFYPEQVSHLSG